MSKYLNGGGVSYLWGKIISLINTETAGFVTDAKLQKINYPSNEAVSTTVDIGTYSSSGTYSKTLGSSLFEYGKAKAIKITATLKLTGADIYNKLEATGKVVLPSGGTYIRFLPSGGFEFLSGGSAVLTVVASWTLPDRTLIDTVYIARVA